MKKESIAFQHIALAKEIEFPENTAGLEKRVALTLKDVGTLIPAGDKITVIFLHQLWLERTRASRRQSQS